MFSSLGTVVLFIISVQLSVTPLVYTLEPTPTIHPDWVHYRPEFGFYLEKVPGPQSSDPPLKKGRVR